MSATTPLSAPSMSAALANEKAMRKAQAQQGKHDKKNARSSEFTTGMSRPSTRKVTSAPLAQRFSMYGKPLPHEDFAKVPLQTPTNVLVLLDDDESQLFDSMRPSVGLSRMASMAPLSVMTDVDIEDECFTPVSNVAGRRSFRRCHTPSRNSRARIAAMCEDPSSMQQDADSMCPESILTEMSNDFSRTASLAKMEENLSSHQRLLHKSSGMPFVLYSCDSGNDGFVSSDDNDVEDASSEASQSAPMGHRAVSWHLLDASCSDIEEDIETIMC